MTGMRTAGGELAHLFDALFAPLAPHLAEAQLVSGLARKAVYLADYRLEEVCNRDAGDNQADLPRRADFPNESSTALPTLHQTLACQFLDGMVDGRPCNAEPVHERSYARQPAPRGVSAGQDIAPERVEYRSVCCVVHVCDCALADILSNLPRIATTVQNSFFVKGGYAKSFFSSPRRDLSATRTESGVVTTTRFLTPSSDMRAERAMQMLPSASTTLHGPSRTFPRASWG